METAPRPRSAPGATPPALAPLAVLVGLLGATALPACDSSCATYVVAVTVEDEATGALLCDARVTFGAGDGGVVVDASTASTDAEVAATSSACQWDVVAGGGTYEVKAQAPGFKPGTATLTLSSDECGTATAPVTVILVRS